MKGSHRIGEMVQGVKCVIHNHENLRLDAQHLYKIHVQCVWNSSAEQLETRESLGKVASQLS